MGLVTSTEMFKKAYEGHYAIGAFNVNNMEIIQGITEAAAMDEARPVILQVSTGARKYAKHAVSGEAGRGRCEPRTGSADRAAPGPRRRTLRSARACIDGGFTSVMIDGSHLSPLRRTSR